MRVMQDLIYRIKPLFPVPVWKVITSPYWWWFNRARHQAATIFDHRLSRSQQELVRFKDLHREQRCFIIGNGPSLKNTDVSKLKDEYTFGMNRIYLAFDDWGFRTSFLVCVNSLVIEQVNTDFQRLQMPKFFSWRSRKMLYPTEQPDEHTHFLFTTYSGPKFATDVVSRMWEGATVTFVCLQLAFHMGFEQAVLIGVDHTFAAKGKPNTTVVSQGDDLSHFDPRYFGKGFRWQLPDLDTSEQSYWMARQAYESAGREVLDATIGGQLQVFPKVEYDSLFSE